MTMVAMKHNMSLLCILCFVGVTSVLGKVTVVVKKNIDYPSIKNKFRTEILSFPVNQTNMYHFVVTVPTLNHKNNKLQLSLEYNSCNFENNAYQNNPTECYSGWISTVVAHGAAQPSKPVWKSMDGSMGPSEHCEYGSNVAYPKSTTYSFLLYPRADDQYTQQKSDFSVKAHIGGFDVDAQELSVNKVKEVIGCLVSSYFLYQNPLTCYLMSLVACKRICTLWNHQILYPVHEKHG